MTPHRTAGENPAACIMTDIRYGPHSKASTVPAMLVSCRCPTKDCSTDQSRDREGAILGQTR